MRKVVAVDQLPKFISIEKKVAEEFDRKMKKMIKPYAAEIREWITRSRNSRIPLGPFK